MEDSRYFEMREKLIEDLHVFLNECESLEMDGEAEIDDLLIDMWDSLK